MRNEAILRYFLSCLKKKFTMYSQKSDDEVLTLLLLKRECAENFHIHRSSAKTL